MSTIQFEDIAGLPVFRKFAHITRRLFGVTVALMRPDEKVGMLLGARAEFNPFCRMVQNDATSLRLCRACDLRHKEQVLAEGRSIRYTCDMGLTDFIIPVFVDREIVALLQCGQVAKRRLGEKDWARARHALRGSALDFVALEKLFYKTPVMRAKTQQDMMELLELFANHIADAGNRLMMLAKERKSRIVSLAGSYVKSHIDAPLPLAAVARACGTSPRNLLRVFRSEAGMTPLAFIQAARIERACDLLQDRSRKVIDIAMDCGFGCIQQFNRVFKRLRGSTPTQWRARSRSD